jgi:ATP adenylyltransferase
MSSKPQKLRPSAREGNELALIDAPWRHTYFEQPKAKDCFICRAVAANPRNDARNLLLVRGEKAVIVLNRYPYTMGALMIAPVAHLADFREIPDETLLEMNRLLKRGMAILDEAIYPKGYNIGINQGVDAGAGLSEHLHAHLVPRWRADTNFMTATGNARVLAEDVDGMYKRLRRVMKQLAEAK